MIAGLSSFIIPGLLAFGTIYGSYRLGVGKRYSSSPQTSSVLPTLGASVGTLEASRPFLIQAAVILALVSGGVGYYLQEYMSYGVIDPLAIKKRFADFHNYIDVSNRTYTHETVGLDGLHCRNCTFDDVVLLWHGTTPFILDNPTFVRNAQGTINYNIRTDNPIFFLYDLLLHDVGATEPRLQLRGGHGPP